MGYNVALLARRSGHNGGMPPIKTLPPPIQKTFEIFLHFTRNYNILYLYEWEQIKGLMINSIIGLPLHAKICMANSGCWWGLPHYIIHFVRDCVP